LKEAVRAELVGCETSLGLGHADATELEDVPEMPKQLIAAAGEVVGGLAKITAHVLK
jgi:hypothetical protein